MKKSTLDTCDLALRLMLDDRENNLSRVKDLLLIVKEEEQKAELEKSKQYYERSIAEINEAIEEIKAEETKVMKNEWKKGR